MKVYYADIILLLAITIFSLLLIGAISVFVTRSIPLFNREETKRLAPIFSVVLFFIFAYFSMFFKIKIGNYETTIIALIPTLFFSLFNVTIAYIIFLSILFVFPFALTNIFYSIFVKTISDRNVKQFFLVVAILIYIYLVYASFYTVFNGYPYEGYALLIAKTFDVGLNFIDPLYKIYETLNNVLNNFMTFLVIFLFAMIFVFMRKGHRRT